MKRITEEWIFKAETDFKVAKRELNTGEPVYDAVCFHCQQCVEKYLKAVLQEKDVPFEKTHDLDVLLELCKNITSALLGLKPDLIELSSFAVEIRYPGIVASRDEAEHFLTVTQKVRKIIRSYWGLEDS